MTSFYNDKRLNLGVFLQQTRILVRYYRESKKQRMTMMNKIKKQTVIDVNKLSGEFYFQSLLQEAYVKGEIGRAHV